MGHDGRHENLGEQGIRISQCTEPGLFLTQIGWLNTYESCFVISVNRGLIALTHSQHRSLHNRRTVHPK